LLGQAGIDAAIAAEAAEAADRHREMLERWVPETPPS